MPFPTLALAARDKEAHLSPYTIQRRDVGPRDVKVAIDYCGVCHSDIHFCRADWGDPHYPAVPGHEILGKIAEVGSEVTTLSVGQKVAVSPVTDNCGECVRCTNQAENYCRDKTECFGTRDRDLGGWTYGGYAQTIVVKQQWVFNVPDKLYRPEFAPLLCAGITSFAPLLRANVGPGQKVGVAGLGGLGHLGVKFARAMGAETVMITTSPEKGEDAKLLGAHSALISTDKQQMKAAAGTFDFILNTIPVNHPIDNYLRLLKLDGEMSIVGVLEPVSVHGALLVGSRIKVSGSNVGSPLEIKTMIEFCAKNDIFSEIEYIPVSELNAANGRVVANKIKYRFVLDMSTLESSKF